MNVAKTESLVAQYQQAYQGLVDYKKYAYFAVTHHSTAIEGATLSESQVINLLEYGKPAANKPFEHHQMVYDHYQAMLFVINLSEQKTELTPLIIRQIGSKVMSNTGGLVNTIMGQYEIQKGDFRLSSVRAGTRTFPDYKKVPELIQKFCNELNLVLKTNLDFQSQCEISFKAHFDFVSIHPFGDGNGRTSRLVMNYVQAYFNLPLAIINKQSRIAYINSLEGTREKDDINIFYKFMWSQYEKFLLGELKKLDSSN